MSIHPGFSDLTELYTLPFQSGLSMVIAEIREVYPAAPATDGSRQELRIASLSGSLIPVQLFDQSCAILQNMEGLVLRISCSPNARKAIVWERCKAVNPLLKTGVLVVRKQAQIQFFRKDQLSAAGIQAFGFMQATPAAPVLPVAVKPLPNSPTPSVRTAVAIPDPGRPATRTTNAPSTPMEVARLFAECLAAARSALGSGASDGDVQYTARVAYEEVYGRKQAAAA